MKKVYIDFDPSVGYPAGPNLYYECLRCGESIPSLPKDSIYCRCGNVGIDTGFGRADIRDKSKMKTYRIE